MNEYFEVIFPSEWIDLIKLEDILISSGLCSETKNSEKIIFYFPSRCCLLLETLSIILALVNQYANRGALVFLDFHESNQLYSYLKNIGFLRLIDQRVKINHLQSGFLYKNISNTKLDLQHIDLNSFDEQMPEYIKNIFVSKTSQKRSVHAYTFISELYANVRDHSDSKTKGLIGLQEYQTNTDKHHIQTVISDNGLGIIGTLRPVIESGRYNNLRGLKDTDLILEIFENGKISRMDEQGRGLGLNVSNNILKKYNSTISIRQKNFYVQITYKNGMVFEKKIKEKLLNLDGTHICIDLAIDSLFKSD